MPIPSVFRLLLAACLLLAGATAADAAGPSFPRGPGFYYSPVKLVALLISFWGWVKLWSWLDVDATRFKGEAIHWNALFLATSLVAILIVWNVSWFWVGLFLFWLLFGGAVAFYFRIRDPRVGSDERVLERMRTGEFWRELGPRILASFKLREKVVEEVKQPRWPVRFVSRNPHNQVQDEARVSRLQESSGYKAALDMVWEAVQKRATDIHLEPADEQMSVRLRIDGVMNEVKPFSRTMGESVINIYKVLCNLDITERRKPQDGSFSAQVGKAVGKGEWTYRLIDFRIATAGSIAGEKLVMRILDTSQQVAELGQVGMGEEMRAQLRDIIARPHGMVLVCGPTGSGKTTTLYACMNEIDRLQRNVITIENPVEYRMDGITQIEVNPKVGKTFASELRSILRQDPDVILVGEIRDKETAEIACQAAQTGHMVFSTVHANDAVTAIVRLIDLGVQPFLIASALSAVVGQRLIRRLCPDCRERYKPTPETLRKLGIDADFVRGLYRPPDPVEQEDDEEPETCERCGGSGYFKRTGVFELLVLDDRIRELIRTNPNMQSIKLEATRQGMRSLLEDGVRLVVEGQTSIQELLRVSR